MNDFIRGDFLVRSVAQRIDEEVLVFRCAYGGCLLSADLVLFVQFPVLGFQFVQFLDGIFYVFQ